MVLENQLIPYQSSALPPGPWLVFAPHADDETFGMGGSLLLAKEQKITVDLIVLTDGTQGGVCEEEGGLQACRRREGLEAGTLLGIRDIEFWDQPDHGLRATSQLRQRLVAALEAKDPETVFFPSPFELNPDHRAAAELVWDGLMNVKFSRKAYAYEIAVQTPINRLIDITPVHGLKQRVARSYTSQLKERNYIDFRNALDTTRALTLPATVKKAEGFYEYADCRVGLFIHSHNMVQPYCRANQTFPLATVSVIVRTKDRDTLLKNALASLAAQTHGRLEVIVVNDGGKDVRKIVDAYRQCFGDLQYVHLRRNRGRAGAANEGLRRVAGKYFIFLDDDDLMETLHIETLVNALQKRPAILAAYSGAQTDCEGLQFNQPFNRHLLRVENYIPINAILFDSRLLEKGCRFDPKLEIYEDWDFLLQAALQTEFHYCPEIGAYYSSAGDSGASPFNADPELVVQYRNKIFQKWGPKWTGRDLQATFTSLIDKNHAEIKQLQRNEERANQDKKDSKIAFETQARSQKKRITELEEKIEILGREKEHLGSQIETMNRENERLGSQFETMGRENDGLKQQLQASEQQTKALERKIERQIHRIAELRDQRRVQEDRDNLFRKWLTLIQNDFAVLLHSRRWAIGNRLVRTINRLLLRSNHRDASDPILELLADFNRLEIDNPPSHDIPAPYHNPGENRIQTNLQSRSLLP